MLLKLLFDFFFHGLFSRTPLQHPAGTSRFVVVGGVGSGGVVVAVDVGVVGVGVVIAVLLTILSEILCRLEYSNSHGSARVELCVYFVYTSYTSTSSSR